MVRWRSTPTIPAASRSQTARRRQPLPALPRKGRRQTEEFPAGGHRRALRRRGLQRLPPAAQSRTSEEGDDAWISAGATYSQLGGKLLVLASVGATLEQITGADAAQRRLQDGRPLVGHDHRHRQVHRLRQLRARLLQGEQRAEGLLPHLGGALPGRRRTSSPTWIRPMAPSTASRRSRRTDLKSFFVPKLCNHCADSPCVQVCPVGATFVSPDGVVLVDETYCLGCRYCVQACPYGCRYLHPETQHGGQVHALLPPHHQGPDHRLLRELPHRRAPAGGFQESQGSRSTNSAQHNKVQVLKP